MRQESLKPSKDLFVELRHMYCDFGGVEFLEGEMRAILETIAPEVEEMGEADREDLMRDPGDLQDRRFSPEEFHLRAGGGVSAVEIV